VLRWVGTPYFTADDLAFLVGRLAAFGAAPTPLPSPLPAAPAAPAPAPTMGARRTTCLRTGAAPASPPTPAATPTPAPATPALATPLPDAVGDRTALVLGLPAAVGDVAPAPPGALARTELPRRVADAGLLRPPLADPGLLRGFTTAPMSSEPAMDAEGDPGWLGGAGKTPGGPARGVLNVAEPGRLCPKSAGTKSGSTEQERGVRRGVYQTLSDQHGS
jgi:hypothetical protein